MPLPMPQDRRMDSGLNASQVSASAEARNQRRRNGLIKPKEITDLAAAAGSLQVVLTWSAPATTTPYPITDYIVEYKETANSAWIVFSDGVSATTGATVTGLIASTAYDFRVSGVSSAGQGRASNVVSATPTA